MAKTSKLIFPTISKFIPYSSLWGQVSLKYVVGHRPGLKVFKHTHTHACKYGWVGRAIPGKQALLRNLCPFCPRTDYYV